MREGSEVAGRADGALRRNHRVNFCVEHRAQDFDSFGADAAESFGERVGAEKNHRARFGFAQRRADAAGVRTNEIDLQLANLFGGNANGGEFAEAGVDTIGGFAAGDDAVDDRARSFHAFDSVGSERNLGAVERDGVELREGQVVASELDGWGGHARLRSELASGFGTFRCCSTLRYFGGNDFGRPLLPQMTWVV